MEKKKSSFSGQIGFVLAAAGSAVGVGNLWRFPYLAAKDGGGLFLLIYLVLVLTFGFPLLTSDIAIGRRTKESAIGAYTKMHPKWKFLGILTFLVPVLIMTYYAVIGGWVTKYAVIYLTGHASDAATDGYFTSFITSPVAPVVFALLFMAVTSLVVYNGVEGGIERVSKYMMPILLVLVVVIAGYSLTLKHTDESGQLRTGGEGLLYYLTPHFEGLTLKRFLQILLDAMSQLFFSLSVSMGFMIGSFGRISQGAKVGIAMTISMLSCFFSGLMIGNMKAILAEKLPWFNRINPAALISDAFYCLNVYQDYDRYLEKNVSMLILAVLFVTIGILLTRRRKYASL